jgi:hypothetical protein
MEEELAAAPSRVQKRTWRNSHEHSPKLVLALETKETA